MEILTVEKARATQRCRYCHMLDSATIRDDGSTNAFVFNFGEEYAHEDCISKFAEETLQQPSNPDVALRYNKGKPKVSYMLHYPKVADVIGRILEVGEVKYAPLNWKKGGNTDQSYLDAAMRHLLKFVNGETFDAEYGTHHLGHVIWNLMTMFELNGHEIMDVDKFNKALEGLKSECETDF